MTASTRNVSEQASDQAIKNGMSRSLFYVADDRQHRALWRSDGFSKTPIDLGLKLGMACVYVTVSRRNVSDQASDQAIKNGMSRSLFYVADNRQHRALWRSDNFSESPQDMGLKRGIA